MLAYKVNALVLFNNINVSTLLIIQKVQKGKRNLCKLKYKAGYILSFHIFTVEESEMQM